MRLTEKNLRAIVAGLRGQRLADVVYYPLATGGITMEEWDFGSWHEPTMGVELITDTGCRYSAIWNDSFELYGLEVFPGPMTEFLTHIGEPGGTVPVSVSDHPCWTGLIGNKIIAADICWDDTAPEGVSLPLAVGLASRGSVVWIAVGRSADPGSAMSFYLGTDEVMVVFTSDVAAEAGIPAPDLRRNRTAR